MRGRVRNYSAVVERGNRSSRRARGRAARGSRRGRRPGARAERQGAAHATCLQGLCRGPLPAAESHQRPERDRGRGREAHRAGDDARCLRGPVLRVDRSRHGREQQRGGSRSGAPADRGAVRQDPRGRRGAHGHAHRARLFAFRRRNDALHRRRSAGRPDARPGFLPRAAAHLARRASRTTGFEAGAAQTGRSREGLIDMSANTAVALALALAAFTASGAEVAGVKLDDKTQVESRELVLNGPGLRNPVPFNAYLIALSLPPQNTDPAAVLQLAGPKRAAIHMLRDVGAEQFTDALIEGLKENHPEADYKALEPRAKDLAGIFAEIKEAKKGMVIALDWTGTATRLMVNGNPTGKPIPGEDFYRALLRIWLGDKPVQNDLKRALLRT